MSTLIARCALVSSALAMLIASANAQSFVNGDFQTGDFTGWTIANTANGHSTVQSVDSFDVTGGGASLAGHFAVGQVNFQSGDHEGITITQNLNLTGGVAYTFAFDWASSDPSGNADGGTYTLIVNGASIASHATGSITGGVPIRGTLSGVFTPGSTGSYSVGAMIDRVFLCPGTDDSQYVDNFRVSGVPEPASMAVLGLGAAALLRRRRRK